MKKRRLAALSALPLLFLLAGCVYLRLLKVKQQLADFDAHFIVGGRPSWTVEFKEPVLYAKDGAFLIGGPPLSVSTGTAGDIHHYEFEMVRASTDAAPTIMERVQLNLHVRNKWLRVIEVPENFLLLFPRRVLEETLRQAKNAQVIQLRRTVQASIALSPEAYAEAPSLGRTRLLLGEPLGEVASEGLITLTYRYRIVKDTKGVPIVAHLTFTEEGDLSRVVINWDTSTVDATYLRP